MTTASSSLMLTGSLVSARQSSSRACPAVPSTEVYWSRIPQATPTNSFSTRWPSSASSSGSSSTPLTWAKASKRHRLDGRRRRQAAAEGHGAVQQAVEAGEVDPVVDEHLRCTTDVVGPGCGGVLLDAVETELRRARQVQRGDADHPVGPRSDRDPGVTVHGHGGHEAVVVVGVAAHQVHATRGAEPRRRRCAVQLAELEREGLDPPAAVHG